MKKRMNPTLAAILAMGMVAMGGTARKREPIATCSFCGEPIMMEMDRMPNPDCCPKKECREKWHEKRRTM